MNRDDTKGMAGILQTVRAHLRRLGVPDDDIDDLTQEVLLAAWEKVSEGAFQLNAGVRLEPAMDAWLYGIAWRQWSHYRERAHWYREILTPDPLSEAPLRSIEPLGALEARSALRCLARLEAGVLEALLTAMEEVKVFARKHDVCERVIVMRRAAARRELAALLDELHEPHDPRPGAAELLQQVEVQRLIFDCLRAVPAEQRDVIIAHDFDEIPISEIARRRNVSESTVYRLHTAGRLSLKAILLARVCAEEELVRRRGRRGYH